MSEPDEVHSDNIIFGVITGIAAFFMLSVMMVFVKMLSETHHIIEVAFYRNAVPSAFLLAYIVMMGRYDLFRTRKPRVLFARVFVGAVSLIVTFMAVAALPLAEATVLFFTSALIVPILSIVFLKEQVGIYRISAILIGFLGVIMVAAPNGEFKIYGVILALSASVGHAIIQIFLRYLRSENPITVTFYFLFGAAVLPGIFMPFVATMPTSEEWWIILWAGLSGGIAQILLTHAFRHAPTTIISPLNYTGLIWASLFDILLWDIMPGLGVFIGGGVIIASNLFILYREQRKKKMQ